MERDWVFLQRRRELRSVAGGIIAGFILIAAWGIVTPTWIDRYDDITAYLDAGPALDRILVPLLLFLVAVGVAGYAIPFVTEGFRRWPFGPRQPQFPMRRSNHFIALIGAYVVSRALPMPFERVSGLRFDGDGGPVYNVFAPIDLAQQLIIQIGAIVVVYLVILGLLEVVRPFSGSTVPRPRSIGAAADGELDARDAKDWVGDRWSAGDGAHIK